jgi:hypothetical protein
MATRWMIRMEPSMHGAGSIGVSFDPTQEGWVQDKILNPRKQPLDCPENIGFNKGDSPLAGEPN